MEFLAIDSGISFQSDSQIRGKIINILVLTYIPTINKRRDDKNFVNIT